MIRIHRKGRKRLRRCNHEMAEFEGYPRPTGVITCRCGSRGFIRDIDLYLACSDREPLRQMFHRVMPPRIIGVIP